MHFCYAVPQGEHCRLWQEHSLGAEMVARQPEEDGEEAEEEPVATKKMLESRRNTGELLVSRDKISGVQKMTLLHGNARLHRPVYYQPGSGTVWGEVFCEGLVALMMLKPKEKLCNSCRWY